MAAGAAFASHSRASPAFELTEVAPGLFLHTPSVALTSRANKGDICNVACIVGSEAAAVVDTGGSLSVGRQFLAAIRTVTDKPIRYVINTHMHPDHLFGNAAFLHDGAIFVGHKNLPRAIAQRQEFYISSYTAQLGADLMAGMNFVSPTQLVSDTLDLDLGNRRIMLKAWGAAHTDNDLTVYDPSSRTLLAGDLLFCEHVPIVDGSLKGWLAILPELKAIPAQHAIPGHGPALQAWPAALAPQQRYLEALAADVRAAIQKGTPMGDAIGTVAQSERGKWLLFDDYHARNVTAAFSELEWE